LAKHLKRKERGVRLFSSKQPRREAPEEYEPETAVPDEFSIETDEGGERGYEMDPTELDYAQTDIPAPEEISAAGNKPEAETAPSRKKPAVKKPRKAAPAGENVRKSYKFTGGRPAARIYRDGKTARRITEAVLIIAAAAAAVFCIIKFDLLSGSQAKPGTEGYVFSPKCVDSTDPSKLITETDVMVNDKETGGYTASDALTIDFPLSSDYTKVSGILGFRGNNFRDTASYGTADISQKKVESLWSADTGTLKDADGNTWSGSGWTGQPLIVSWPDAVKKNMKSMYDWARAKSGLVEAIYPTMDGKIYFLELSTGKPTRAPMDLGYTFKGTGTLDPRGYPILYLGSGVDSASGKSRVFVIDLLDCSVMYRFGYYEPFAPRAWNMWDASPLVDAGTDQLVYPGENGVLYIVHLNTLYDQTAGTVTMNPDNTVRWKYTSSRTTTYTFWEGFEASPVCYQGHIIMADNGGNLMCLDLNTLKLDWVQDVLDDTNCSPVLSVEDDGVYVYISTSFHPGWRDDDSAIVPVWKINAVTGEIVWETDYACTGDNGLCGGAQGTAAIGKNNLKGMIFVPLADSPDTGKGRLIALDTKTGKQLWEFDTDAYSWSSPVDVYDGQGNGYLVYTTSDGGVYLLDGLTGKTLDTKELGGNVEASPAVYGDYAVIGTRDCKIFGLKLS
jgi:outer membrane protein assembly factor BamB